MNVDNHSVVTMYCPAWQDETGRCQATDEEFYWSVRRG